MSLDSQNGYVSGVRTKRLLAHLNIVLNTALATDAGLIFLDSVDFYINFILILIGFFETLGAGWIYHIEDQITSLGPEIVFVYMFTHFGSLVIASGLWFGLDVDKAVWGGFLGLFVSYSLGLGATFHLLAKKIAQEPEKWNWNTILYELCLKNVMDLRAELSSVVGYMPWVWAFAMKNICPHILLVLFINLAQSKNGEGDSLFGNYGGYVSWPFQILGVLSVVFAGTFILVGIAMPIVFEPYDLPYLKAQEAASVAAVVPDGKESNDTENHGKKLSDSEGHEDEEDMS
jgi:hypothetical protein